MGYYFPGRAKRGLDLLSSAPFGPPGLINPCSRSILAHFDEQAFSASQLLVPTTLATQPFDICSRNDDAGEVEEGVIARINYWPIAVKHELLMQGPKEFPLDIGKMRNQSVGMTNSPER
jgi:hypothetical protein